MDQKWFVSSIFGVFCFLNFSNVFHVASYTLSNSGIAYNDIDSNARKSDLDEIPVLQKNFPNDLKEANGKLIEQPSSKDAGESKRWLNVLTFDKHCNLTEKDKGPQNETKNIFISTEEHLQIFGNGDEEEEDEDKLNAQLQEEEKNIFHLLSPENFLSQIISQDQSRALERTKRQAEDGKRRCRCRRIRRRGRRRRRRRRNGTGQQRQTRRRRQRRRRRRNGRRRGRRRCVCRKRGDGEGKSDDGEEPEVEEADGEEEGTTEGGDETTTEEEGEEGGGDEEEGEEGSEEKSDEEEDDEEDEEDEGEDDEESASASKKEMPPLNNIPTYVFPYPNMVETPIAMIPVGAIPVGSYPRSTTPVHKMPSYLAVGTLLSGNSHSNTEE